MVISKRIANNYQGVCIQQSLFKLMPQLEKWSSRGKLSIVATKNYSGAIILSHVINDRDVVVNA